LFVRAIVVLALAPAALVVGAPPCLACTCIAASDEEQFTRADVVFVGRVIERHDPNPDHHQIDWTIEVESVQKGQAYDRQHVLTTGGGTSCGSTFVTGERYQVFADRDGQGSLHTSTCSGTRTLSDGRAPYQPATPAPPPPPPPPPPPTASPTVAPSPTPSPVATASPAASPSAAPEEASNTSTLRASLAAGLAVVGLGIASVLALRRRS
jgi:hypothetical protein